MPLQFLAFDTTTGPGAGLTTASIQYHGPADVYTHERRIRAGHVLGRRRHPVDRSGGDAVRHRWRPTVAFTFDLAKSILLTRHGNPRVGRQ